MNGEGDFILASNRTTLARTIMLMETARFLAKPVRLVNSNLSLSPSQPEPLPVVKRAVRGILARCESITYRDPQSLELHQKLFGDIPATATADALFGWAGRVDAASLKDLASFGPSSEGLDFRSRKFFADRRAYVAISGSSWKIEDRAARNEEAAQLAHALESSGFRVALIAADRTDTWLSEIADLGRRAYVPPIVPLRVGLGALRHARALVSGRYHPSILSLGFGVPCVFMASNSHKNVSVQSVMGATSPREYPFFGSGGGEQLLAVAIEAATLSWTERRRIKKTADRNGDRAWKSLHDLS